MSRYDELMDFLEEVDEKMEDLRESVAVLDRKLDKLTVILREYTNQ